MRKPCCGADLLGPHVSGCDFEPREDNPIDYGGRALFGHIMPTPPPLEVSVAVTRQLNAGIAAQLRALADLLDPPHR